MGTEVYDDIWDCVRSRADIKAQIATIDEIITALQTSQFKRFGKGHVQEYQINDGQSILRVQYTSLSEMTKELFQLERWRNMLLSSPKAIGRVTIGRDRDSFFANKR